MIEKALIKPIVTEKSQKLINERKYVFLVHKNANKEIIKRAVEDMFNVKVEDVNIVKKYPKKRRTRYQFSKTPEEKKAIVKLKEGYTIDMLKGV
ncbi:MAG TPA: 50S ribosomal protein L23 [Caldisericia bacterium]|nr:50S ribosomal protein L23 [Caldisericia bacterium]HOL82648.1 50S ribosomal protein L23 [Caldisericia bacterium]HPP43320.1 50S ribosomal protein L23 [Caldisericia bacterium]